MSLTLTLFDEVNCHLEGLRRYDIDAIIKKTSLPDKNAFMTAAYQTGNWDGRQSFFDGETCIFFQHMIGDVLDVLEGQCGYDLEQLEIQDDRVHDPSKFDDIPLVDENFFEDLLPYPLREHQVTGINKAITNTRGILEYATSAGKTFIAAGIVKSFEPKLRSMTIVPSAQLVQQTLEAYQEAGLDVEAVVPKLSKKKREEAFKDTTHLVMTGKILMNCADMFEDCEYALLYDETHVLGEEFAYFMRTALADCPVRVGLTGTVPRDKLKRHMIECHLGGGVMDMVAAHSLMDKGYVSQMEIEMVTTRHHSMEQFSVESDKWDWDMEAHYLQSNRDRLKAIAQYLGDLPPKNTLILCHPQTGNALSELLGAPMIDETVSVSARQEHIDAFDVLQNHQLCASYGTSSTGISTNGIRRVILIDVGKNEVYTRQGIGRGLRLDGDENHCEVIDIAAKTKYSERHTKKRRSIYRREKFSFRKSSDVIEVE